MKETTKPKYRVIVADNFHYMREDEHYTLGDFDTLEAPHAASREIVDDELDHTFKQKPGISAQELYELYTHFDSDPFVRAS